MTQILYRLDAGTIAAILFVASVLVMELCCRLGQAIAVHRNAAARRHIDIVQTAMLGLVALLLGFTFSLAFQRYETRSGAVVDEANAIGSASLLAQALPAPWRDDSLREVRGFLDLRVAEGRVSLERPAARAALLAAAEATHARLWRNAVAAAAADPRAVAVGQHLEALTKLGEAFVRHRSALERHVPEAVSAILFVALLLTAAMLGGAAGIQGVRPLPVTYLMLGVLVAMVYVIADIDRPRRGFVRVSQASLLNLQTTLGAAAAQP